MKYRTMQQNQFEKKKPALLAGLALRA